VHKHSSVAALNIGAFTCGLAVELHRHMLFQYKVDRNSCLQFLSVLAVTVFALKTKPKCIQSGHCSSTGRF